MQNIRGVACITSTKNKRSIINISKNKMKNRPTWELKAMIRALESMGGFFNTEEDNQRLKEAKEELKNRK